MIVGLLVSNCHADGGSPNTRSGRIGYIAAVLHIRESFANQA